MVRPGPGFRDNLAIETALEFPGVTRPLIDTLISRRLIRLEDRLGVQRVELTHDVLAEVIRASRDTRQQRLATEQLRARERLTRRRMWLARTIAAGLLVGLTGVSWIAQVDLARLRAVAIQQFLRAAEVVHDQRTLHAIHVRSVRLAFCGEFLGLGLDAKTGFALS